MAQRKKKEKKERVENKDRNSKVLKVEDDDEIFTMPHESESHEGTWLQWPHSYELNTTTTTTNHQNLSSSMTNTSTNTSTSLIHQRIKFDEVWLEITKELIKNEIVNLIVYNNKEKERVQRLLKENNILLNNIHFYIFQTNDFWIRDNGPIFVYNSKGSLRIEDWGFNGWGKKFPYQKCNQIPFKISEAIKISRINLNHIMINEGGAIEIDSNGGVLIACKSSIISQKPKNSIRNLNMTKEQAEKIFQKYLGVKKIIWLDGKVNDKNDVTDCHIDGFVKFLNSETMITMNKNDLIYWGLSLQDIQILYEARNIQNIQYNKIYLPLTSKNVINSFGKDLGYKGSYINYYIANGVVLIPKYYDKNDDVAKDIIQKLYPNRSVIGIDCRDLYELGGMIHCITQQQPIALKSEAISSISTSNSTMIEEKKKNQNSLLLKFLFVLFFLLLFVTFITFKYFFSSNQSIDQSSIINLIYQRFFN